MFRLLILFALAALSFTPQDEDLERHVVRRHKNGTEYVVVYTKGPNYERVREELYYDNGQLDYVGNYQRGVEHGEWIYYWRNGNMKSIEYYEKGRENGIMWDFDDTGKKIREYKYMRGILVKEIIF
jgi:antitoxin component YwqK of YwqJK toxin-antitoxin module